MVKKSGFIIFLAVSLLCSGCFRENTWEEDADTSLDAGNHTGSGVASDISYTGTDSATVTDTDMDTAAQNQSGAITDLDGNAHADSEADADTASDGDTSTVAECKPGDRQCFDVTYPEKCDKDGYWQLQSKCEGTTGVCLGGVCVECSPKDMQCHSDGITPQECDQNGVWQNQSSCTGDTPACIGTTGLCGVCFDKDTQCANKTTPQICDASGAWVSQMACGGDTPVCQNGECICESGTEQCTSTTVSRACVAGEWIYENCGAADQVCVTASGTCEECIPGQMECVSVSTARACVDGNWISENCAADNKVCVTDTGTCEECQPGDSECVNGGEIRICSSEALWETSTCSTQCLDDVCVNPPDEPGLVGCNVGDQLACQSPSYCCYETDHPDGFCTTNTLCGGYDNINFFECDGPTDCSGSNICCLRLAMGTPHAYCTTEATCLSDTFSSVVCNPENPNCETGQDCTLVIGYNTAFEWDIKIFQCQ